MFFSALPVPLLRQVSWEGFPPARERYFEKISFSVLKPLFWWAPSFQDLFLGTFLGPFWEPLGAPWDPLGAPWDTLGTPWGPLGYHLDHLGAFLVLSGVQVDSLGLFRGAFSAFLKVSVTHLSILADVVLFVVLFFVF